MPLVDPMTGNRLRPAILRDSSDHLYAWEGEAVDWLAKAGEVVVLVDRAPVKPNRVMFVLEPAQLAKMLMRALGTQEHETLTDLHLSKACRAFLAAKDAMEPEE